MLRKLNEQYLIDFQYVDFIIPQFANRESRITNNLLYLIMKSHNGMRPQDIVVLLKIIALGNQPWHNKDLAWHLNISSSEISESLNRSQIARLIDDQKKKVFRQSLMEFLEFGLPYVFPVIPGPITQGIPTAHSHPFMQEHFTSPELYVWPNYDSDSRGQSISPLYKEAISTIRLDPIFYKLMALTDVIRVGRPRELKIAQKELRKIILHES
jgi:hypothetical protein